MNYIPIDHHKRLIWALGLAGLIPFLVAFVAAIFSTKLNNLSAELCFVSYSALICSFLSGTLWGVIINESKSKNLLILSNVICLVAWACLLLSHLNIAVSVLMLLYPLLYLIESRMVQEHTPNYICMRRFLTVCVVVLHGLFLVAIN